MVCKTWAYCVLFLKDFCKILFCKTIQTNSFMHGRNSFSKEIEFLETQSKNYCSSYNFGIYKSWKCELFVNRGYIISKKVSYLGVHFEKMIFVYDVRETNAHLRAGPYYLMTSRSVTTKDLPPRLFHRIIVASIICGDLLVIVHKFAK